VLVGRDDRLAFREDRLDGKCVVAGDLELGLPEMGDQRVEILVLGNNVEAARRVAGRRRSEVIGQGEVEGIPSRGVHLDQPDLGRMLPDLLHEADLQPLLSLAEQQGHLDGRFPDPAQIDRLDVLEIDEDVVIRLL
jgi:hypothetical protein